MNLVTPAKVSGGHKLLARHVRPLDPRPNSRTWLGTGGGVRVPRVTGVGSSLGANVLTGLNLTLQPNVARDPGDE